MSGGSSPGQFGALWIPVSWRSGFTSFRFFSDICDQGEQTSDVQTLFGLTGCAWKSPIGQSTIIMAMQEDASAEGDLVGSSP